MNFFLLLIFIIEAEEQYFPLGDIPNISPPNAIVNLPGQIGAGADAQTSEIREVQCTWCPSVATRYHLKRANTCVQPSDHTQKQATYTCPAEPHHCTGHFTLVVLRH